MLMKRVIAEDEIKLKVETNRRYRKYKNRLTCRFFFGPHQPSQFENLSNSDNSD